GTKMATETQAAVSTPLPKELAGVRVKVHTTAGTEHEASLLYVSPNQINCVLPSGLIPGTAALTISRNDGKVNTGTLRISDLSPGLFSADASGKGLAAAVALRVKANGNRSFEPVARFIPGQGFVPVEIDLGEPTAQVFI